MVLPPVKSADSLPETTTDALEAYGICVIDFNALRASKGLLGEAARTVQDERDKLDKIWDEDFRSAWEKAQD